MIITLETELIQIGCQVTPLQRQKDGSLITTRAHQIDVNCNSTVVVNGNGPLRIPNMRVSMPNDAEFTMGETREETLNNILDTLHEPNLSEQNTTTLTDQLRAIAREYGLSGKSLFAFLRKHVFRGG